MSDRRREVTLEMTTVEQDGSTLLAVVEATDAVDADKRAVAGETPAASDTEGVPDRLELVAAREIVLRCGQASVTLTRAGKIILRGTYVLSRSSGLNGIKGASVQIN